MTLCNISCMHADVLKSSPFIIRDDLNSALGIAWSEVAQIGSWLNGEQRLAIAGEARQAWGCKLCKKRKEALSPYGIEGEHDHLGLLPISWVEAVHRIVAGSGRITESWYDSMIASGIVEDEFIEILSLTTIVTCVDTFTRGIGLAELPLPKTAEAGTPARKRPGGVKIGRGWAPTVAPEDAGLELGDFYDVGH
jgi:hypothetical protein